MTAPTLSEFLHLCFQSLLSHLDKIRTNQIRSDQIIGPYTSPAARHNPFHRPIEAEGQKRMRVKGRTGVYAFAGERQRICHVKSPVMAVTYLQAFRVLMTDRAHHLIVRKRIRLSHLIGRYQHSSNGYGHVFHGKKDVHCKGLEEEFVW
jgi:hypothetical protein